jgi:hypothetical protein
MEFNNSATPSLCLNSAQCHSQVLSIAARNFNQTGDATDQKKMLHSPKLGWTLEELARSLSVSVPFLRLE